MEPGCIAILNQVHIRVLASGRMKLYVIYSKDYTDVSLAVNLPLAGSQRWKTKKYVESKLMFE